MKALQNTISNLRFNTGLSLKLLLLFLAISSFGVQAQCPDSIVNENIQWLEVHIDSLETEGCEQNCDAVINLYCSGDSTGELIYAIEPTGPCNDVPILFYSEDGDLICSHGSFAGSDCDSGFVESLTYIDNYWSCTTDSVNCDLSVEIASNSDLDSVCIGETVTLTANASGGTPGYTYSWFEGSTTQSITFSPTPNMQNYVVWVTDANECATVRTIDINVINCNPDSNSCENLGVTILGPNEVVCIGETIDLTAIPFGGTSPYVVEWEGPWLSNPTTVTYIPTESSNKYFVTITDANNCIFADSITVLADSCNSDTTFVCNDSFPNVSTQWLDAIIDSLNTIGCQENCYAGSNIYCSGNVGSGPIYALEADLSCNDVPTLYFDSEGNLICSDGSIAGSDCDSGFVENLIYVDTYWTCQGVDTTDCSDFSVEIDFNTQDSVCVGESITLVATVTGGTPGYSYDWNTGSPNSSITVSPTPNDNNFIVWVNDANGCAAIDTVLIDVVFCIPDSNDICTDSTTCVFPGDGNKNYVINNYDVLNLGFGFEATGPAREQVSIAPQYFTATDWNSNGINNINLKHADCNGDGVINTTDVTAIDQNYSENSGFNEMVSGSNDEIALSIDFSADTIVITNNPGDTGVFILEAELVLNQGIVKAALSGLAFQIDVDNIEGTLLDAYVTFDDDSWLTDNNTPLTFSRFIADQNRIDVAVSRTDQIPVAGSGRIGKVYMVIEDIIIGRVLNQDVTYSATAKNVVALNDGTSTISVKGEKGEVVLSADIVSGTNEELKQNIKIFPNPVRQQLLIKTNEVVDMIQLFNLEGQLVQINQGQPTIDLSNLPNGQYIIKVITPKGVLTQRIIKIK